MPVLPRQLVSKRNEIAYEVAGLHRRARELEVQLSHLDAALMILNPDFKPSQLKLRKPRRSHNVLPHGDAARAALIVLRQATKPLTTPEVIAGIIKLQGITFGSHSDARDFASSIGVTLRRYEKKGAVEVVGGRGAHREIVWQLTDNL